jgi:glycosyltransferase involved in cell wall biosynthesis
MKIALLIPTLNGGGAERVMSFMANYWTARGHEIHLITHDSPEHDFYPTDPGVIRHGFDISRPPRCLPDTVRHNIQRISLPRARVKDLCPDVAISFTVKMNIQNLIALYNTGIPIIVSERNNPLAQKQSYIWEVLRAKLYPFASAVVLQTHSAKRWAQGFVPDEKIHVIPNPLTLVSEACDEPRSNPEGRSLVCSLGRLIKSKGFDLLLRSFHQATVNNSRWDLLILGEGEERSSLEQLVRSLGISERVFLPGRVRNPADYLRRSEIFVLPSRHEGFPNALLEAMSVGLPVVSSDCPFGPSEIITHGVDGLLVPTEDIDALARAVRLLMETREKRESLGFHAGESAKRYLPELIMSQWDELISDVIQNRKRSSCGSASL